MPGAVTGLELARRFYCEAVRPILAEGFPRLTHSAALFGPGSEVLGYDDEMSRDHHWGPRVLLFVGSEDLGRRNDIAQTLSRRLPPVFLDSQTSFGPPDAIGVRLPQQTRAGEPVSHMVEIHEPQAWFSNHLNFDPSVEITDRDWLSCPPQRLLEATAGEVFHDGLGALEVIRRQLAYYPRHIWIEMLAARWQDFDDEQPFVGRCGLRDDDLGSRLIAARQAQRLMELCLMMERRYIPYSKWLEAAFNRLPSIGVVAAHLHAAVGVDNWKRRENALVQAAIGVIEIHNGLALTEPIVATPSAFHNRPFRVAPAGQVAEALRTIPGPG